MNRPTYMSHLVKRRGQITELLQKHFYKILAPLAVRRLPHLMLLLSPQFVREDQTRHIYSFDLKTKA